MTHTPQQVAVEYDSSPWTEEEMVALAERTFDALDAEIEAESRSCQAREMTRIRIV